MYIHDRGDYKSGWELERDWEEKKKLWSRSGQDEEWEARRDKVPCSAIRANEYADYNGPLSLYIQPMAGS